MTSTVDASNAAAASYFHAADYVVFGIMLLLSAGIGLFYGIRSRRQRLYMANDYLMAGRQMSFGPVSLSLIASFMSSVTILGVPAEYYIYGTMFSWYGMVYLYLPLIIVGLFIPVFYDLEITSTYEYLERRFNRVTRLCVTCLYLILSLLYGGVVTYGPALALSNVTGLNLWGSILCTGTVCIFYTVLGGLKAVIWTDVLQSVLMLSGFFVVIIQGSLNLGGFSNVLQLAADGGRMDFIHFELDPRIRHTFWTINIGGTILWLSIFGVNQSQVQRYLPCKTKRHANISALISGVGLIFILLLAGMTGLTIYATYKDCDPIKKGLIDKPDELFPYIIMDIVGHLHGVPGLFVAAVYSSSLSTISSGINAMACVALEDFIRPVTDWRELTYTRVSRLLVLIFGLLYIATAYLASVIGGLIRMAYGIHGMLGGPITAVFILGMMTTWVNAKGVLCGLLAGIMSNVWLFLGKTSYPPSPEYQRALPTYTNSCSSSLQPTPIPSTQQNYQNVSFESTSNQWDDAYWNSNVTEVVPTIQTDRPPIAELYAISYLYVIAFGFFTTLIVSMIVSAFTGSNKEKPSEELLAPCLRHHKVLDDTSAEVTQSKLKADGIERSGSWFQPDRYSVHLKDKDQILQGEGAFPSNDAPLLSDENRVAGLNEDLHSDSSL